MCPACGSEHVRLEQRKEPIRETDVQGDFRYEITVCDACGDATLTFGQAEAYSRAYAATVARARGTLTPDRIYDLRFKLGKTQAEMEQAFGVGPKTWGRWERGTVAPSGPAARLLWIAENDRAAFHRMAEGHDPRRQQHVKVVGTIAPQGFGEDPIGFSRAKPSQPNLVAVTRGQSSEDGGSV